MTIQKVKAGQPIRAAMMNQIIDQLPSEQFGANGPLGIRLILCRTTEAISAATIDEDDTEDSVYGSGLVDTYGLINNEDGTFSPGITNEPRIMINASKQEIASGTELWAIESNDGVLISTVWVCG